MRDRSSTGGTGGGGDDGGTGGTLADPRMSDMIRQGRSFSGRERNCLYLNTGQTAEGSPRFANISAASGADWPDDGRGVAIVDWDADGDLDMWISNRNGPRLRLMRNDTASDNHFVRIKLVGDGSTTNRDAIGARVEVHLASENGNAASPLIQTLRAGEGFISQSSKWMHFGLGSTDKIERVVVRWPSAAGYTGETETFTGIAADGRYRLVQGSANAELLPNRTDTIKLKAGTPKLPKPAQTYRVASVTRYRVPVKSLRGRGASGLKPGTSVLINLWGSWCRPCRKELKEFAERARELRAAGVDVVAVSVDSVDEENGDTESARAFLKQIKFPFVARPASAGDITVLSQLDHLTSTLNRPLPIPSSFLIDPNGNLAIMYKGRVTVDQLLQDVTFSRGTLPQRHLAAAGLPGSLIEHESVAASLREDEALIALRQAVGALETGNVEDGGFYITQALSYQPELGIARYYLSGLELQHGRLGRAVASLHRAIGSDADSVFAISALGSLELNDESGKYTAADEQILALHTKTAWRLATSTRASARSGTEAVRWAERIVKATKRKHARSLEVLAAAYAEAGRFAEAVATAEEARAVADALEDSNPTKQLLLDRIGKQLEQYRRGEPHRDPKA